MIERLVLGGHLIVAALIISLVLLQRGKGAEAGTGFGAGASGTVFGARGSANFFSRATAVLATLFFATSLALAYFATQGTGGADSLLEGSLINSLESESDETPALGSGSSTEAVQPPAGEAPAEPVDDDEVPSIGLDEEQ